MQHFDTCINLKEAAIFEICVTEWLTNWLTDRLTDWQTDWLTEWLTNWLTDWLTEWLTDIETCYRNSLTHACSGLIKMWRDHLEWKIYISDICSYNNYIYIVGYTSLSCLSQEAHVLRWSIPTELSTCISRLQYFLHYSKISGFLEPNATTLSLDMLDITSPCNVDVITITPIFHVRSDPICTANVMGVISKGISTWLETYIFSSSLNLVLFSLT